MIIAVDFDGTLCVNGQPNTPLILRLKAEQARGNIIILWTCRERESLNKAILFLQKNGLKVNYINCNPPEIIRRLGHDTRKIYADVYIDDKSYKC